MSAIMDAAVEELLAEVSGAAWEEAVDAMQPHAESQGRVESIPARRRGRPKSSNRAIKTLSLPQEMWEWLELWHPGNPSEQMMELVLRGMKMWPGGPSTCPAMKPEKIAEHAAACRAMREPLNRTAAR